MHGRRGSNRVISVCRWHPHAPILQTVAELLSALGDEHFLLIIDQFEDVLNSASSENLEELLSGLSALRELTEPRLHVLISYRADLEGRLGPLWQRISGGIAPVFVELCEAGIAVNDVKRLARFGQERGCLFPFRSERQAQPARQEVACMLSTCESPSWLRSWPQQSSARPSRANSSASHCG